MGKLVIIFILTIFSISNIYASTIKTSTQAHKYTKDQAKKELEKIKSEINVIFYGRKFSKIRDSYFVYIDSIESTALEETEESDSDFESSTRRAKMILKYAKETKELFDKIDSENKLSASQKQQMYDTTTSVGEDAGKLKDKYNKLLTDIDKLKTKISEAKAKTRNIYGIEYISHILGPISKATLDLTNSIDEGEIEKDIKELEEAINKDPYEKLKNDAITIVKKLSNLNEEYRKKLEDKIKNSSNVRTILDLLEEAKKLDKLNGKIEEYSEKFKYIGEEIEDIVTAKSKIDSISKIDPSDKDLDSLEKIIEEFNKIDKTIYKKEEFDKAKTDAPNKINGLNNLSEEQKKLLVKNTESVSQIVILDKKLEEAKSLDEISFRSKEYVETLKKEVSKNIKLIDDDKKEINDVTAKFEQEISKLVDYGMINEKLIELKKKYDKYIVDLYDKKYTDIADAFLYKSNNIEIKKDSLIFDIKVGGKIDTAFGPISNLLLGTSHRYMDINIAPFIAYDYQKSHNASLGLGIMYKDFSAFARYRLAIYNGLLNHNIDLFAKYSHNFNFQKLNISYLVDIYSTYASKVKANDGSVVLNDRVGVDFNMGIRFYYDILPNLKIFSSPKLHLSYNNQKLVNTYTMAEREIKKPHIYWGTDLGLEYVVDKFVLTPSFDIKTNFRKELDYGFRLSSTYKFK